MLIAQPDDLSDIDIWMSMSIIISITRLPRNIAQQCAKLRVRRRGTCSSCHRQLLEATLPSLQPSTCRIFFHRGGFQIVHQLSPNLTLGHPSLWEQD